MITRASEHSSLPQDWRRDLRRKIAWTLVAKLFALLLLWAIFFRSGHP
jgi:hypothetical protein